MVAYLSIKSRLTFRVNFRVGNFGFFRVKHTHTHFKGMIRGQGQGLFDPGSSSSSDFGSNFTNEILSLCLTCTAFASLLYVIFQKISCFNRSTDPNGKFTESNGMLCCKNILCVNQDRTDIPLDDVETVKSMDISEYGPDKQLPAEVNAAAYATAQFLQCK